MHSNVLFQFKCLCDTNKTYIVMSSRYLSIRVEEHLDFSSSQKSLIKDHIKTCNICSNTKIDLKSFQIIRICCSEYHTVIQEALVFNQNLFAKSKPPTSRQRDIVFASNVLKFFYTNGFSLKQGINFVSNLLMLS